MKYRIFRCIREGKWHWFILDTENFVIALLVKPPTFQSDYYLIAFIKCAWLNLKHWMKGVVK